MRYSIDEGRFGNYETIILRNNSTGESAEIAKTGATLLNYYIPLNKDLFNIVDGFSDETELESAGGSRSWIMVPFANRIPGGRYDFLGSEYAILPVPPKTRVIHGFGAFIDYKVISSLSDDSGAEVKFETKEIREGAYIGYPFSIDIRVSFRLEENKLTINIEAENRDNRPALFAAGWHPYFRTNPDGIGNLILTLNAEQIIKTDDQSIPLPGDKAYADIKEFPEYNFNEYIPREKRVIGSKELDNCYAGLKKDFSGFSGCSLYDPSNNLEITMFQKGGVTLVFSGDTLEKRKRKSVALEPMMAITNAFNREEYQKDITIQPGEKSQFTFGVMVKYYNPNR
jgi:aldose 1-epimerase